MMYLHKKIGKVKIKSTNKIKYDQKINGYVVIIQISFGPKLVAYSTFHGQAVMRIQHFNYS